MMIEYPEHEKLKAIKDESQAVHDFLVWCQEEKGYGLAEYGISKLDYCMSPVTETMHDLIAEHFDIDDAKIEEERRAMIEELRRLNEKRDAGD